MKSLRGRASQKAMAVLFDVGIPDISKHLKHVFETGELKKEATVSKMEIVVKRGFRGEVPEQIDFYSLDAIIAVGYRVNSLRATQFRQWATAVLRQFAIRRFPEAVPLQSRMRGAPLHQASLCKHSLAGSWDGAKLCGGLMR